LRTLDARDNTIIYDGDYLRFNKNMWVNCDKVYVVTDVDVADHTYNLCTPDEEIDDTHIFRWAWAEQWLETAFIPTTLEDDLFND